MARARLIRSAYNGQELTTGAILLPFLIEAPKNKGARFRAGAFEIGLLKRVYHIVKFTLSR